MSKNSLTFGVIPKKSSIGNKLEYKQSNTFYRQTTRSSFCEWNKSESLFENFEKLVVIRTDTL